MATSSPTSISLCCLVGNDRLDRFLSQELAISRAYCQKLIATGKVTINHQVCSDKNYPIGLRDAVAIDLPAPQPLALIPQPIPLDILFEDDQIIVINKPAGLVVHPAPGHTEFTLVHALLSHCANLSGINGMERPGIVHRLDKDTSGVMVIAKTDRAHQHLQQQIQAKTARRRYLGIVEGIPKTSQGTVCTCIGRHPHDRHKMAVMPEGRNATTHWQLLARGRQASLLQFDLETGRTHQIRVHSAHIGHGIVNDPLYGKPRPATQRYLAGQALHAWQLQLIHPTSNEKIHFRAHPTPSFTSLLQHFQISPATIIHDRIPQS